MSTELDSLIERHDTAIAASDIDIWIGAEPTFTLRASEEPEWLSQALGGDKAKIGLRIAAQLCRRHPESMLLRSVGRQYGGEDHPRWSFGVLRKRDGSRLWQGPPDPALGPLFAERDSALESFMSELLSGFKALGWRCLPCAGLSADEMRLLVCPEQHDEQPLEPSDPRLTRQSVHNEKTPHAGLHDPLAEVGALLFIASARVSGSATHGISLELPAFPSVALFEQCLSVIDQGAVQAELRTLLLGGFPPPVDDGLSWTTITPDPAVIEINQAPEPDLRRFQLATRELFEIADEMGLSPYRMQYNGTVSDSGGSGQFTLGGRSASDSPFFRSPQLLPRLVSYFNRHPALSFLFATDYVGSASQSPRADEGVRDAFHELQLTLRQLAAEAQPTPEFLWQSLAPFMTDPSGNTHRSELNVEKLWNPHLAQRGCQGLLEFRAFRMATNHQRAVLLALLLRSITAMLAKHDLGTGLVDWGDELHDRFALPFFLRRDLDSVLADLGRRGLGLDASLARQLSHDDTRPGWQVEFGGCQLSIEPAVEFWPLVGDVASQERGGSRLVDSSTQRLQIAIRRTAGEHSDLAAWKLSTADVHIPLQDAEDEAGNRVRLIGLRYRDFTPWRGLHPGIGPQGPITLTLSHPDREDALEIQLHSWRSDGLPYPGLPETLDEAAERRRERLICQTVERSDPAGKRTAPTADRLPFTVDLRRHQTP